MVFGRICMTTSTRAKTSLGDKGLLWLLHSFFRPVRLAIIVGCELLSLADLALTLLKQSAVLTRRKSTLFSKCQREVGLIGKAALVRNLRDTEISLFE
jgi:hypothetical protein